MNKKIVSRFMAVTLAFIMLLGNFQVFTFGMATGGVTMADVSILRQYIAGHDVPINLAAADVNGDGVIDYEDVNALRRYIAGHPVFFPTPQPLVMPMFGVASSEGQVALEVQTSQSVVALGEYVFVDVYLSLNPGGLMVLDISLAYDPRLEVVQVPTVLLPGFSMLPPSAPFPNPLRFGLEVESGSSNTGALVSTLFRVRDDAVPGIGNDQFADFTIISNIIVDNDFTMYIPTLTHGYVRITETRTDPVITSITPYSAEAFTDIPITGFNDQYAVFNIVGYDLTEINPANFSVESPELPFWLSYGSISLSEIGETEATLSIPLTVGPNMGEPRYINNFTIANTITPTVFGTLAINQLGAAVTHTEIISITPTDDTVIVFTDVIADGVTDLDAVFYVYGTDLYGLSMANFSIVSGFPDWIDAEEIRLSNIDATSANLIVSFSIDENTSTTPRGPVNIEINNTITPAVYGVLSISQAGYSDGIYYITIVDGGENAYANPNPAQEGDIVTLNVGIMPDGKIFVGWSAENVYIQNPESPTDAYFIMVNEAVSVTANWELMLGFPEITVYDAPNGRIGILYDFQFAATGIPVPTWTLDGSLPPGLSLDSTGRIFGTPTMAGVFTFTVTAGNLVGTSSQEVRIVIFGQLPILTVTQGFARPGEEVDVAIRLDRNPGFSGMTLRIDLPEGLTLVSYNVTDPALLDGLVMPRVSGVEVQPGTSTNITGTFFIGWTRVEDFTGQTGLLNLTLETSSAVPMGELPINVAFASALGEELPVNADGDSFDISVREGGGVTIRTDFLRGDVNGDNSRNSGDGVALARHLAEHVVTIDMEAADINQDGNVDLIDLLIFRGWLVGDGSPND